MASVKWQVKEEERIAGAKEFKKRKIKQKMASRSRAINAKK